MRLAARFAIHGFHAEVSALKAGATWLGFVAARDVEAEAHALAASGGRR